MKNVVSLDEIREVEMRPQSVFEEYFRLLEKDIPNFFENKEERDADIARLRLEQYTDRFEKLGFLIGPATPATLCMWPSALPTPPCCATTKPQPMLSMSPNTCAPWSPSRGKTAFFWVEWIMDSLAENHAPQGKLLDMRANIHFFGEAG